MAELKTIVENKEQGKKSKILWEAFVVAAEDHDLNFFKEMLVEHERRVIQERQEQEAAAQKQEEEEVAPKKAKRKSGVAATEDVEMEDATSDAPKKSKKSNKRKAPKEGEPAEVSS
jgi:DNA-binding protein H-NS